jgi:GntR family transcriptional repressor for pyruvate dehydrogenase complex
MIRKNHSFKKVKLTRGYKEVAQQIKQAIIDQHWRPGDKLPPQNELMQAFQVSKFTLMGALRILEQSGLVYTKHGATGGTFISEMNTEAFSESLKLLISMKKITLDQLAEFRLTMEGRVAYLAAKRRRSKDIQKLKDLLDNMAHLLASNAPMEEMIRMDMEFHLAIAAATYNNLYLALMETINECFLDEAFSFIPSGNERKIYTDHLKIFKSLLAKEAGAAEKAVKSHITFFERLIIRNSRKRGPQG